MKWYAVRLKSETHQFSVYSRFCRNFRINRFAVFPISPAADANPHSLLHARACGIKWKLIEFRAFVGHDFSNKNEYFVYSTQTNCVKFSRLFRVRKSLSSVMCAIVAMNELRAKKLIKIPRANIFHFFLFGGRELKLVEFEEERNNRFEHFYLY